MEVGKSLDPSVLSRRNGKIAQRNEAGSKLPESLGGDVDMAEGHFD
jgi:hypothetical protein